MLNVLMEIMMITGEIQFLGHIVQFNAHLRLLYVIITTNRKQLFMLLITTDVADDYRLSVF